MTKDENNPLFQPFDFHFSEHQKQCMDIDLLYRLARQTAIALEKAGLQFRAAE